MTQWIEVLLPSLVTWMQHLEPTPWREKTNFNKLSSDLLTCAEVHHDLGSLTQNKEILKDNSLIPEWDLFYSELLKW